MSRIWHVLPQLRYVEDIMQVCQMWWQSNLVCYRSNPPHDLIWANESRSQLPRFKFSPNACCRSHSEKYVITCLKHKRYPPLIYIGFLPTLNCMHSILYHLHLLGGLLQELWPKHY